MGGRRSDFRTAQEAITTRPGRTGACSIKADTEACLEEVNRLVKAHGLELNWIRAVDESGGRPDAVTFWFDRIE